MREGTSKRRGAGEVSTLRTSEAERPRASDGKVDIVDPLQKFGEDDSAPAESTLDAPKLRSLECQKMIGEIERRMQHAPSGASNPSHELGRYMVTGTLGHGGMGVVFKAFDPTLDRQVALKVLHEELDPRHATRLLREAQALARLSHPNVVQVYEVGEVEGQTFLAMELVDGLSVEDWMRRDPRPSWRECIDVFLQVGDGLAAAHEQGLVHRDFKPSNAIIDDKGRARVLDFGLARSMRSLDANSPSSQPVIPAGAKCVPLEQSLTTTGAVMGTPAYMPPEQMGGEEADARSDQFSFCVALYEAVYGTRPFVGDTLSELLVAMLRGSMQPLPRGSKVPDKLRTVLLRGLSILPDKRWPSMEVLLEQLRGLVKPRRGRWLTLAGGVALGSGLVGAGLSYQAFDHQRADPCAEPEARLEQAWSPERREAVRDAYHGSGHPEAAELLGRVEGELDRYTAAWVDSYASLCRATFVTRQQSESLFDRQVFCLERRRSRLHATVDALAQTSSPREAIERTVLPFKLPMLDDCAAPEALASQQPLPADAELRERIAELRARIDQAQALADGGDSHRALELARSTLDVARHLDYPPTLAEALESLGSLQAAGSSARDAEATLTEAIQTAARAEADQTAARAWTWLLYALMAQNKLDQGLTLELAAQAAVDRAGNLVVRGWLLNNLGALYTKAGQPEHGIDHLEGALEVKQQALGADHVDVGISWLNLGMALSMGERYDDAHAAYAQAREVLETTVGEAHPLNHHVLAGLCTVEYKRRNVDEAVVLCDRVLEHIELSPWSAVNMGEIRLVAAKAQWEAGQRDRARATAEHARTLVAADNPTLTAQITQWLDDHPAPR